MSSLDLGYPFTVGLVASISPCGFAMLPAYLSFFVSSESQSDRSTPAAVARALVVGLTTSAGVISVFALAGVLIKAVGLQASDLTGPLKWVMIALGLGVVALGIALLAGWHLPWSTPRVELGGKDRSLASMFLFGVSYAVASLSCGLPVFIGVVLGSFNRDGFVSGVAYVATYGVAMGMMITSLTIALALGQRGLLTVLRKAMRYVDRVAGFFLVIVGFYLVYYWWNDGITGGDVVSRTSARIENWIANQGTTLGIPLIAVLLIGLGAVVLQRRKRQPVS
jgi:cytochrome c-type biogenesis protein